MNNKTVIKFDQIEIELLSSPNALEAIKGGAKNTKSEGHLEILQHMNFICWVNDICPVP